MVRRRQAFVSEASMRCCRVATLDCPSVPAGKCSTHLPPQPTTTTDRPARPVRRSVIIEPAAAAPNRTRLPSRIRDVRAFQFNFRRSRGHSGSWQAGGNSLRNYTFFASVRGVGRRGDVFRRASRPGASIDPLALPATCALGSLGRPPGRLSLAHSKCTMRSANASRLRLSLTFTRTTDLRAARGPEFENLEKSEPPAAHSSGANEWRREYIVPDSPHELLPCFANYACCQALRLVHAYFRRPRVNAI